MNQHPHEAVASIKEVKALKLPTDLTNFDDLSKIFRGFALAVDFITEILRNRDLYDPLLVLLAEDTIRNISQELE